MKINVTALSDIQLSALLREFNLRMAETMNIPQYKVERDKYAILKDELRRRREKNVVESLEVIRSDAENQFGIINHEYFKTLEGEEYSDYINWKWDEL